MEQNNLNSKNTRDFKEDKKIAMRVSTISVIVNVILSLLKLIAGIVAKSGAMVSDAVHSASDVFSTFIVMVGVTMSNRKSDKEHQYGHERLECVASILLAVTLAGIGAIIGYKAIIKIVGGDYGSLEIPGFLALAAAVVSIVVKEWMYWFTRAAAKKINSGALMADAWHHRSDALSSIGSFIGIFGARLGFPILDPIASVVICIFIIKVAYDVFMDSIDKLVDKACPQETIEEMKAVIMNNENVGNIDDIRSRLFGSRIYVDVEIALKGDMSLEEAHNIAEQVHDDIEEHFPDVKHCMVHVNPLERGGHHI
ncbi:cation diffusion facilitator family transporter [Hathewaya proteolytica DSM 3090]|uniref:Cation diffusion facilitator family transporter n=1 Tax=Hathewaya proteolytica DSM 3090 TaxID=1121331 RepID=A0A1M6QME0_9CLOT|nr:cation diffusion facilitator family transporter [Hathewaya proteolytica]SHK21386.1 cation diffusion facilitator family transporter [Hathewaya proteolytica DSM 3090]